MGGRLLQQSLRLTFGDRSVLWKAPLLGALAASVIGLIATLGYSLAHQDHVLEEREGPVDFGVDQLWWGIKFLLALIVWGLPMYVLFGGMLVPVLIDLGAAGLSGAMDPSIWDAAVADLTAFFLLSAVWMLAWLTMAPAIMTSFMERGARLTGAFDVPRAIRIIRAAPGPYAVSVLISVGGVSLLVASGAISIAIAGIDSGWVMFLGPLIALPSAMALFLLLQNQLGLMRRHVRETDPYMEYSAEGWHHLRPQADVPAGTGGFVTDQTPEAQLKAPDMSS